MTLIKSISGIRGTIGGKPGEGLTPIDIVKFSAGYGIWLKQNTKGPWKVVVGRDARKSGPVVSSLITITLQSLGISVKDLGLATTPTVEVAVTGEGASGGIIVTASHNPGHWNALKLLNSRGEFLSASDGEKVLSIAEKGDYEFALTGYEGKFEKDETWTARHIKMVKELKLVDPEAIKKAGFTVAVDTINSVGGVVIPDLLYSLGVRKVIGLNTTADGDFAHNPEPLPENLTDISEMVKRERADVGFVVDPDVDRLAIICEDGSMFGEEYTLVAVSDYVLSNTPGTTVSNMSSTRALRDVTEKRGCSYFPSAVGEVNVVEEMKKRNSVIGGEGNGGVIYPELHYGRDALVGIGLFLTHLAKSSLKCSELRKTYPDYFIAKKKLELSAGADFKTILEAVGKEYVAYNIDLRDGMKIDLPQGWIQLRKSNTEPIMRIYAEAPSMDEAEKLAGEVIKIVKKQ